MKKKNGMKVALASTVMLLMASPAFAQKYKVAKVERTRILVDQKWDAQPDAEAARFIAPYKSKVCLLYTSHAGVIFDGFPRTTPQAEALKKMLSERGHKIAAMIELAVPEDELMARLINRGKESGRSDDNEETIKKRLNVYHTQTAPLIDWYEKEGIHHHIEGLGTVDEIFARVCNVIDNL